MNGWNLKNLVCGTRVASDVAVTEQVGSKPALERTNRLSHPRRLSLSLRNPGNQPGTRPNPVDAFDAAAAIRTGRSVRPVGVLVRRCLAMMAGRTVLWGRSIAVGGLPLAADGCFGYLAKPPAAGGSDCSRSPRSSTRTASTRGPEDR
jgi:hypothetical protein